jgi:putative FmdB family regulatory protein
MPIYEYLCAAGHVTDAYATVERRHEDKACATCGGKAVKAILHAPRVFGDYEGYLSPATGRWIEGRRARVEDLKQSGCRPFEAGEHQHAAARSAANDRQLDAVADDAVERSLNELTS